MAANLGIGINISLAGADTTSTQFKALLREMEQAANTARSSNAAGTGYTAPINSVRQAPAQTAAPFQSNVDLQNFATAQTTGLLKTLEARGANVKELMAKMEAGATSIIAAGAKPLEQLIATYTQAKQGLDKVSDAGLISMLDAEVATAMRLRDEIRASKVPQETLLLTEKTAQAQSAIQSLSSDIVTRGGQFAGSYANTVINFVRSVGKNNASLGQSLQEYVVALESGSIEPGAFTERLAVLGAEAAKVVNKAQTTAQKILKDSLQSTGNNYATALRQATALLFPSGIPVDPNVVDQTMLGTLRQGLSTGFQKQATKDLGKPGQDFTVAKTMAAGASGPNFDINALMTELAGVDIAVNARIKGITDQLVALKAQAYASGDVELYLIIDDLEKAVNKQIKELRDSVALERDKVLKQATTGMAKAGKNPADLALAAFGQELRGFETSLARVTDIQKGSGKGQNDSIQKYAQFAETVDKEITDLIQNKIASALTKLDAAGASGGLKGDFLTNQLTQSGFFGADTTAARITSLQGVSANLRQNIVANAPTATPEQVDVIYKLLDKQIQDMIQSYRVHDEIISQLNTRLLAETRSSEEAAIAEKKFAEAREIRAKAELAAAKVPVGGAPLVAGNLMVRPTGMTQAQLLSEGVPSGSISSNTENASRAAGKLDAAENRVPGFLTRMGQFASRLNMAFMLVQQTVGQVVNGIKEVLDQANQLEKTSATISALAGNFQTYSNVIAIAQKQQEKFGGSLNEQLAGFSNLVPISRKFNVNMEQLDNVARRLAIVDPLQGFSGASIALKEFFSGDITSLSRRFEIDRSSLNAIKGIADQGERLQALDDVLASMGISSAVLTARSNTAAASFDKLGGNWANTMTLVGQGFQSVLKPAADAGASMLNFASEALTKNLELADQANTLTSDIAMLAGEYQDLEMIFTRTTSANSMDVLSMSVNKSSAEMDKLIEKTNQFIDQLNEIRLKNNEALIPRYDPGDIAGITSFTQAVNMGIDPNSILNRSNAQGSATKEEIQTISPQQLLTALARMEDSQRVDNQALMDIVINAIAGGAGKYGGAGTILPPDSQAITNKENMQAVFNLTESELTQLSDSMGKLGLSSRDAFIASELLKKAMDVLKPAVLDVSILEGMRADAVEKGTQEEVDAIDARIAAVKARFSKQIDLQEIQTSSFMTQVQGYERFKKEGITPTKNADGSSNTPVDAAKFISLQLKDIFQAIPDGVDQVKLEFLDFLESLKIFNVELQKIPQPTVTSYRSYKEEIEEATKKNTDQSFAIERQASAIEFVNQRAKEQNTIMAETLLMQYANVQALHSAETAAARLALEASGLFDTTSETKISVEAQAVLQAQALKQQSLFTLEANRSVSAFQAMADQHRALTYGQRQFSISMSETVALAKEFVDTMQGFNMGTMLSNMSPTDQLDYQRSRLSPGATANTVSGPQNQKDVFSILSAIIGLEQGKADAQAKENLDRKKLMEQNLKAEKEYQEKRLKAEEDGRKEIARITEKYLSNMDRLLQQSEITKRGNKADFYESLFGMKITDTQRGAAIDKYKGYEEEARKLRDMQNFTAAQAVLDTGSKQILDQVRYDAEVLQKKKEIADADATISELEAKRSSAKTAADRKDIETQINKVSQEKSDAANRILQIEGLRKLRADADDEEVKQARKKQEQITLDYREELNQRGDDLFNKLAEDEAAYNRDTALRNKADDEATNHQLVNMSLLRQMELYQQQALKLARASAGMSETEYDKARTKLEQIKIDMIKAAPDALKQPLVNAFKMFDTLQPNPNQEPNAVVNKQIDDMTKATQENTAAMLELTKALREKTKELTPKSTPRRERDPSNGYPDEPTDRR
jgi:hypothetical protein